MLLDKEEFNSSGSKYLREIQLVDHEQPDNGRVRFGRVDVYAVIDAFEVVCPARAHAIKKLLCAGLREKASEMQDLTEALDAISRAIQMQKLRKV